MQPAEKLRFDDRAVVVTGGGAGLGREYALLLAARGAGVVVADYGVSLEGEGTSSTPAEAVAAEITATGGAAVACYASVSDPTGATAMVEAALDTYGRLDAIVNNAGIVDHAWMDALDEDQVRRLLDNHAIGTFLVTKAAWPHLVASGAGRVVNTVSESMLGNTPKAISYAAAKGAVFGLTRGMALDGLRHGVRVNAVAPRGTTRAHDPKVLASVFEQPEASFAAEFFSAMRPELVAPVVAYLAHEICSLDGEVLVAGAGQVRRLVVGESAGILVPELTPEDVAAQLDAILDSTVTEPMPVGYSAALTVVSELVDPISEARRQWVEHGWVDAAPGMAAVTSIMRAQQVLLARVDEKLAEFDLSFARFELLRLLAFTRHGELPLGKLGVRLQVHPTSITSAVDRLEAQGFVERRRHPTDGRTTLAVITRSGRRVVERATAILNDEMFADVGGLSEREVAHLYRLLEKVRRSS